MSPTAPHLAALHATKEANRALNIQEFEQRATTLRSRPRVLFVELTENCNLSCPMCRSAGPFDRSRNMAPDLFDRLADELFPTAEIVDLRGWGESTILKRFPDFVDKAADHGCRIQLVTNLTVTNEQMWRRLVRQGARINVSFDAASPETFADLRGGARLDAVLRNLEAIMDEAANCGLTHDTVVLNVVVQSAALPELRDIVKLGGQLGVKVKLNVVTLDEDDPDNLAGHREELARALHEAADEAAAGDVRVQLNTALDPEWADLSHTDKTCTHPWMYFYVNYRGQAGFCDHLIGIPGDRYLIGDLRRTSFEEIWNGERYQRLRAEHAAGAGAISEQFEECRWCYRNRYVDFDEDAYPPYADHQVMLTPAHCAGFVPGHLPGPASPRHRLLPVITR
ncbi:radical SAM/SPASM domain-containing protein [Micromonospora sp. DT227]|uniref:radical SAM/SPASM domain-containing protein n=1 Tax=Micromonospora sp. DT227 TaxID=3393433 RepID=UPI003CE6E238